MNYLRRFGIFGVVLLGIIQAGELHAKDVLKGTCGENIQWSVTDKNELIVSGEGPVDSKFNWQEAGSDNITKITLKGELELRPLPEEKFPACTACIVTGNSQYKSVNGLILSADGTRVYYAPKGKKGEIVVPEGVKELMPDAFMGCTMSSVKLPKSLRAIGASCFQDSHLQRIELPEGLYHIGTDAFEDCESLQTITIPSTVLSIEPNAFSHARIETLYWNPVGYKSDCRQVFQNTPVREVVFGEGVKTIPANFLYRDTTLRVIRVPESVMSVGKGAFTECLNVEEVYWNAAICSDFETGTSLIPYDRLRDAELHVRKMVFGNKVKRIPNHLCTSMTELQSVVIPNSVIYIGDQAFWDCYRLREISIGSSVRTIGHSAFGYTAIQKISIPASLEDCGYTLFLGNSQLSEIEWNVPSYAGFSLNHSLFYYEDTEKKKVNYDITKQIRKVRFGEGVTVIPDGFCARLSHLNELILPYSLKRIGDYAFAQCSSLIHVELSDQVKQIGTAAFEDCGSLVSINLPESMEDISAYVFKNCQRLTHIELPRDVARIGKGAFYSCSSLDKIQLPGSVYSIGEEAFMYTNSTIPIVLPDGLESIGNYAFSCVNTTAFEISEKNTHFSTKNGILYDKEKTVLIAAPRTLSGKIKLPNSVREIAAGAMAYTQIETVELPNKLTKIGVGAFYGSTLTSITIPKGVDEIGDLTFKECKQLKTAKFKNNTTTIESGAFEQTTILSF